MTGLCPMASDAPTAGYFRHRRAGEPPCSDCTSRYTAHIAEARQRRGRKDRTYPITCAWCGVDAEVTKPSVTMCSQECAKRALAYKAYSHRLPVLHPNPDPLTWLPVRHPAVTPRRHASLPGQMFVSGPCAWCEESFTALAADWERRSVYCSKRCGRAAAKARRGHFSPTPAVRAAIYERDGWVCQLCSDPVDPDLDPLDNWAASLDHIVCRSWTEEPDDSPENLRLAHRWCNSVRGDETYYPGEVLAA